ncbi:MAG TPA: hypothetical protein VEI02_13400 [Planctomycetota bacterium]|nr:hypothetical protein [Planctomycetota bacterium]
MRGLIGEIDRLLRGRLTAEQDLREGRIGGASRAFALASVLLGVVYGAFMGIYGATRNVRPSWEQWLATTVKLPLLFLLTLAVTFPSLYVFSALKGSRLGLSDTVRLLLAAIAVNLAVLASFGPVTAFFTVSTHSYPFMVLLNVAFCAISGFVGVGFLRKCLRILFESPNRAAPPAPPAPPAPATPDATAPAPEGDGVPRGADASGAFDDVPPSPVRDLAAEWEALRRRAAPLAPRPQPVDPAGAVFRVWAMIFAVVGAQMGWILRPFIGAPNREFEWFRKGRESNVFEAIVGAFRNLFE